MFKKGWRKRALSLLMTVSMLFVLSGCSDAWGGAYFLLLIAAGDNRADRTEIFGFVRENEEALMTAIEEGDFSALENTGFIRDIEADATVVDFSCGGFGVGSSTSYVGFYYTRNGDMTSVWCAPGSAELLLPSGEGFIWCEENGDNTYYTEHVCGNFYYYEASF